MNTRVMARAGGAMLVSLVSLVGVHDVEAAPAVASREIVHATGSRTSTPDFETFQFVPKGRQCLLLGEVEQAYTGTLEGTASTVEPQQILFFVTCDELRATPPGTVLPTLYRAVWHFVGTDGSEATFREFGRTDASGNYRGIEVVSGDLNGILQLAGSVATGANTYDGILVLEN